VAKQYKDEPLIHNALVLETLQNLGPYIPPLQVDMSSYTVLDPYVNILFINYVTFLDF
jgi:hypothetical protein